MTNVNWQECSEFDYSDNFNKCSLKFTDNGFRFEFYNECKCDGETLEVVFDIHGKLIVIEQDGNGSYGVMTTDMIPENLTRDQINKYMTDLAAGWISEFILFFTEQKS